MTNNTAIKIRSKYNFGDTKKYTQDLSRKVETLYSLDENNEVVVVGETNVYDKIQVCRDECDIYNIIKRYESGDFSAIGDPNLLSYGDVSNAPKDIIEQYNNMDQALANWQKLPKELRHLYNDNITEFMNADASDINSKVKIYMDSLSEEKKEGE